MAALNGAELPMLPVVSRAIAATWRRSPIAITGRGISADGKGDWTIAEYEYTIVP
jgi:hypothetical protein